MKIKRLAMAAATAGIALGAAGIAQGGAGSGDASPIYGVKLPEGYRQWQLIAPAQEAEPLNELRAVLGNDRAIKAYQNSTLPFPDGTVLVKLAWKHVQSPEFEPASIPGAATTVQVMVKDANKYASTGGWGFGRFINGKPADEAQHQTCFACHQARVQNHDFVFTRFAP
ncbi:MULTISPECIES: cytochrome P460 family protein [Pseudomonas]|uniref:cytochrome P460 family protein n=1 Tax=Pseudomonas TaxID=286 RepID=UPI00070F2E95|nr:MULTISPECIES: cytochrome P460 family protein [Pseudomonas]KQW28453.1 cytochrome C oxidase subunit III [Pseudomonas sp. Root401]WHS56486.1 cytochrome P460 family protein [Pseudomonas brassicacearum]